MATFKRFEEIEAWQKARVLAQEIYLLTKQENFSRDFKLINQINSSSGSIMDNIAEGFGRGGNVEFVQFLAIAKGSAEECKSQLYRILDRNYIDKRKFDRLFEQVDEIGAKLNKLIFYLNQTEIKGLKFKNRTIGKRITLNS